MASKYDNLTTEELRSLVNQRDAERAKTVQPGLPQATEDEYQNFAAPADSSFWDRVQFALQRSPENQQAFLAAKYKQPIRRGPKEGQYLIAVPNSQDPTAAPTWKRFRDDAPGTRLPAKFGTPGELPNPLRPEDVLVGGAETALNVGAAMVPGGPLVQATAATIPGMLRRLAERAVPGEQSGNTLQTVAEDIAGPALIAGGIGAISKGVQGLANSRAAETAIKVPSEQAVNPAAESVDAVARPRLTEIEDKIPGFHMTPGDLGSPSGQAIEAEATKTPKWAGKIQAQEATNLQSIRDFLNAQKPGGNADDLHKLLQQNYGKAAEEAQQLAPGQFDVRKVVSDLDEIIKEQEQVNAPVVRLKSMRQRLLDAGGEISAKDMANELKGVTSLRNTNLEAPGAKKVAISKTQNSLRDALETARNPGNPMKGAADKIAEMRQAYAQGMEPINQIDAIDSVLKAGEGTAPGILDPQKTIAALKEALSQGDRVGGEVGELAQHFKDPATIDNFIAGLSALETMARKPPILGLQGAERGGVALLGNQAGFSSSAGLGLWKGAKDIWHSGYMKAVLGDKAKRDAIVTLGTGVTDAGQIAKLLSVLGLQENRD